MFNFLKPDNSWIDNERASDELLDVANGRLRTVEESYAKFREFCEEKPSVQQLKNLIKTLKKRSMEPKELESKDQVYNFIEYASN